MQLQIALQGCKLLKVWVLVVVAVLVGESEGRGAAAGLQAAQGVQQGALALVVCYEGGGEGLRGAGDSAVWGGGPPRFTTKRYTTS